MTRSTAATKRQDPGGTLVVIPPPPVLLRIELAALLVATLALYAARGGSWWWFLLVLAPDLGMLGYLRGPETGAATYNLFHTLVWPVLLCFLGLQWSNIVLSLGLIWAAHIFADRTLGYGLKYPTGFQETHLQRI